jgi:GNAT superfamily N-acetyltransferase
MYAIREASQRDLAALPMIEQAAGTLYWSTPYRRFAYAPNVSEHIDTARDRVWIIAENDEPVGFVIVREFSGTAHIHEIDVHPRCARRGLGRRLIEHVANWASARGHTTLTLTTFGDVPWNGPYYSRLGFATIPVEALSAGLREILLAEAAAGFPMQHRVAMRMVLCSGARPTENGTLGSE